MKLYTFNNNERIVCVIAETETQARQKAKLDEKAELIKTETLNDEW